MDMWKSLDSLKAVVSEGVREFGNATREGIQDIQGQDGEQSLHDGLTDTDTDNTSNDGSDDNSKSTSAPSKMPSQGAGKETSGMHALGIKAEARQSQQRLQQNSPRSVKAGSSLASSRKGSGDTRLDEVVRSSRVPSSASSSGNTGAPPSDYRYNTLNRSSRSSVASPTFTASEEAEAGPSLDGAGPPDLGTDPSLGRERGGGQGEGGTPSEAKPTTRSPQTARSDLRTGGNTEYRPAGASSTAAASGTTSASRTAVAISTTGASGTTSVEAPVVKMPKKDPGGVSASSATSATRQTPAQGITSSTTSEKSDDEIKRAYADMKGAYDEMRVLLKKSMGECMRLSEEVMRLESEVRGSQVKAAESAAEAKAAYSEAMDNASALAGARKAAEANEKKIGRLKDQLQKKEAENAEAAATTSLEELHTELTAMVRKAAAAVDAREAADARAVAAEEARAEAEAGRQESDQLRREAQAEAHAALATAAAERSVRAEAEGLSVSLKQDSERRARVFNNAVKAAVGKVQKELEAERDELQVQLRDVQRMLQEARAELRRALSVAEEASNEAAARTADAANAGNLALVAEQMAERAVAREQEATAAASEANLAKQRAAAENEQLKLEMAEASEAADKMATELATLQADLRALQVSSTTAAEGALHDHLRLVERAQATSEALVVTERQLESAQKQASDLNATSQVELELQKKRIEQLEMEAAQMRTSSKVMSLFNLPTKQDVLAGLGLEVTKDDRLRLKTDVEEGTVTPTRPRPVKKLLADGSSSAGAGSRLLGIVPMRMWLIIGYLSLLHVMVMMSFTRSNVSLDCDMRLASHPNVTLGDALTHGKELP